MEDGSWGCVVDEVCKVLEVVVKALLCRAGENVDRRGSSGINVAVEILRRDFSLVLILEGPAIDKQRQGH
jgi:hypothetical protein